MTSVIRFREVSKRYRLGLSRAPLPQVVSRWLRRGVGPSGRGDRESHVWALRDVSFELEPGESLALVGPNGAGKTTVLKLLAHITRPTSGQIEVEGRVSTLIELGAGFHPELTGRENVFLNATILGLPRREVSARFDDIVDFAGLARFIDTPVKRYSSGMLVRLGFSVASCLEPDVLLVDEVLAVGDAAFRQRCVRRIRELVAGGTSLIFVSHNLWLVQAVCRSALYLDHGEVQRHGSTDEVTEAYDRAIHEERARRVAVGETSADGVLGETLALTSFEVVEEGGRGGVLRSDRAAEIRLDYLTREALPDLDFVLRIIRSDGVTCSSWRLREDEDGCELGPGRGRLTAILDPLQLAPGSYHAQVVVLDATGSQQLMMRNSRWFQVEGASRSRRGRDGVFEPFCRWQHERGASVSRAGVGPGEERLADANE